MSGIFLFGLDAALPEELAVGAVEAHQRAAIADGLS